MMKKTLVSLSLAGAFLSMPAAAEPLTVEQYKEMQKVFDTIFPDHVQVNYNSQSMTSGHVDTLKDNGGETVLTTFSPSATWDLHESRGKYVIGVTVGYTVTDHDSAFKGYNARIKQEHTNFYVDGQIQLTKFQKIKPFATLGVGYLTTDAKVTGADGEEGKHVEVDTSDIMPRAGVGVELETGKHWSVGLQYNYQMGDVDLTTTSAYLEFNF